MGELEYSYGTVRGKDHLKSHRSNQDAMSFVVSKDVAIGVVCDGCGSGERTELGAIMGSRLLTQAISLEYPNLIHTPDWGTEAADTTWWWSRVLNRFLTRIAPTIYDMGGSLNEVIDNYFLFTTMVSIIDRDMAIFASIGDGVIIVNGEAIQIGPFPKNAPPYVMYNISPRKDIDPKLLQFQVNRILPTSQLESFLIGCDGVRDLMALEDKDIPGLTEKVGNISQFWTNDRYFKNPALLSGRLTMLNGGLFRVEDNNLVIRNGLLLDDTTLIVGRKKS